LREILGVKGNRCLTDKSQIAHEILAYLAEHPDAQDTLEGIVHWWLLERNIKYQMNFVREILDDLVLRGSVRKVELGSSVTLYQIGKM
jgi:hypothetical protein